jgi:hypothetical protein
MTGPEVGKAYRGTDGTVRWVVNKSTRGNYRCLCLDEREGVWVSGGVYRADRFPLGEPYPAPRPGETYHRAGVFGDVREFTVEASE